MTAQTNATAVLALLNAALPTSCRAWEIDKVPSPRPGEYVDFAIGRRFGGAPRVSSQLYLTGYRVTVRAVSQTSMANARNSLEKCRAALETKALTVGSQKSTPIQFETEDPADANEGWFSGLLAFTYTIHD